MPRRYKFTDHDVEQVKIRYPEDERELEEIFRCR